MRIKNTDKCEYCDRPATTFMRYYQAPPGLFNEIIGRLFAPVRRACSDHVGRVASELRAAVMPEEEK